MVKIFVVTSPNYIELYNIFTESLQPEKNDIKIYSDIFPVEKYNNHKDIWHNAMRFKMNFILNELTNTCEENEYVILSDADIQFIRPEKLHDLIDMARSKDLEYFGMAENTRNEFNGGFVILKNTQNIRDLYKTVYERILVKEYPFGDQTVLNDILPKSNIKNEKIPREYVIWGESIYDKNKSIFHHAVCVTNIEGKIKQMSNVRSKLV